MELELNESNWNESKGIGIGTGVQTKGIGICPMPDSYQWTWPLIPILSTFAHVKAGKCMKWQLIKDGIIGVFKYH